MTASELLIPALINGTLTAVVFLLSRRSLLAGLLGSVTLLITIQLVIWFWPGSDGPPRNSRLALFGTYFAVVAFTFLPGAVLAIVASRLSGRRRAVVAIASTGAGLVLGAAFIVTLLGCVCQFLGDCL